MPSSPSPSEARGAEKRSAKLQDAYRDLLREHTATLMAECADSGENERPPGPPQVQLDEHEFKAVQRQAIALLATFRPTEVARRLQIGRRTLYDWMKDEAFNRAVAAEVSRREHDLRSASNAACLAAIDACRDLLDERSPTLRLQAASVLLRHCSPTQRADPSVAALRAEVEALARIATGGVNWVRAFTGLGGCPKG